MKKILTFCLFGVAILLCTACDFNLGFITVTVSGKDKEMEKPLADTTYGINFDNLNFTNSNVTIKIIPVTDSKDARIEVTYSEALDHYGFNVDVQPETISIRLDSNYRYDIDTFRMEIYAVFDEVDMSGGGYNVSINATGTSKLNVSASGAVDCSVSSLDASTFGINTSGSSSVNPGA